jgi:hypothetical protein
LWRLGSGVDLERAHNPKVAGSNPAPATIDDEGLADAAAANPFRLPRLYPGSCSPPESANHDAADTVHDLVDLPELFHQKGLRLLKLRALRVRAVAE